MTRKLSETDAFVLLAKRRRRRVIRVLQETPTPVAIAELAQLLEARERGTPSDDDTREVHVSLHHNHLPRLEEAGVVRYDREDGTVRLGRNFDVLVDVLEKVGGRDQQWSGD